MQLKGVFINQKAVSRIETGDRIVADYELMVFVKVLNVDIKSLIKEN